MLLRSSLACENMPEIPQCAERRRGHRLLRAPGAQRSSTRRSAPRRSCARASLEPRPSRPSVCRSCALVPRSSEHLSASRSSCSARSRFPAVPSATPRRATSTPTASELISPNEPARGLPPHVRSRDVIPLQLGERGSNPQSPKPRSVSEIVEPSPSTASSQQRLRDTGPRNDTGPHSAIARRALHPPTTRPQQPCQRSARCCRARARVGCTSSGGSTVPSSATRASQRTACIDQRAVGLAGSLRPIVEPLARVLPDRLEHPVALVR